MAVGLNCFFFFFDELNNKEKKLSKFHSFPQGFASRPTVHFVDNLSALPSSSDIPAAKSGFFSKYDSICWLRAVAESRASIIVLNYFKP